MPGPHDLLARFPFGQPERAEAELRAVLPVDVAAQVDWASLRRESGSVVDPELRERQSDLLFSARLRGGQPLLLYLLLEHQSTVDRWMALRMLRYVVRQLERWRREHPESDALPLVIPLVMYHGPEGAWTAPRRVEELFPLPGEGQQAERWRALVPRFETKDGPEDLRAVVRYLAEVEDEATHKAVRRVLNSVAGEQRTEELMVTVGEKLVEKGRQQGLLEGLARGRAEDVLKILAVRGIAVDEDARQIVLSCRDLDTLDQWLERALTATRFSDLVEAQ